MVDIFIIVFRRGGGVGVIILLLLIGAGVRQCRMNDASRKSFDISVKSPTAIWCLDSGAKYLEKGKYNRAIGKFTKLIEISPNAGILNLRAAAYYGLGNLDSAITDWDAAVKMDPDNAALRRNLGNARRARGRK
jgi:tetratricopeptide (TPR) repeat protein